ncbi:MAG TPA: ribbon-helix-helix protein, CopG family [Candidatus Koribacter sp.]
MPTNKPITLRLDPKLTKDLDKLAESTQRSRSFLLTEAVKEYVSVNQWQIEKIQRAIEAADRGEFVSDEEIDRIAKKSRRRAG